MPRAMNWVKIARGSNRSRRIVQAIEQSSLSPERHVWTSREQRPDIKASSGLPPPDEAFFSVIPGCATWRRPEIHTPDGGYGLYDVQLHIVARASRAPE
jgi:hypothetical protein